MLNKKNDFMLYAISYFLFMIAIRYVLSNGYGFIINHCFIFFIIFSIIFGFLHGFRRGFNINIVFLSIFIMLFIGIITPKSVFFKVYSFVDFYYIATCTILILLFDIIGSIRRKHLIIKECYENQQNIT